MQDSLAGRAETIELEGFSQSELHPSSHPFLDRVLRGALSVSMHSKLVRSDYLELACLGGYPEIAHRLPQRRSAWFREYAKRLTRRDLKESGIRRDDLFEPLLRMCAARTASELNVSAIASDMQAPTSTIPALLDHLESMFLIKRLPAWSKNLSERVIRRPKLLMTDSGFAASLAHLNADSMSITRNPDAAGAILETFVLGELRRQNGWSSQRVDFFHYRDREGRKIDLIADLGDGRVIAIEVKASSTPTAADTKHLRWLSERLGAQNFVAGILLHTGPRAVPFATNIFALPIEVLWT